MTFKYSVGILLLLAGALACNGGDGTTDTDTGSKDTGASDTASGDTGSGDTGNGDTGGGDTGSGDAGSGDTGSGDAGGGKDSGASLDGGAFACRGIGDVCGKAASCPLSKVSLILRWRQRRKRRRVPENITHVRFGNNMRTRLRLCNGRRREKWYLHDGGSERLSVQESRSAFRVRNRVRGIASSALRIRKPFRMERLFVLICSW